MRDQKTKAQIKIKKNKLWDNTHPLSPHPHPDTNQPPPTYAIPPIIYNNNTMDTEFLVQMRQSNQCGSVRNDEMFNLHLGDGVGPWVSIPCLLQDTSQINTSECGNSFSRVGLISIIYFGYNIFKTNLFPRWFLTTYMPDMMPNASSNASSKKLGFNNTHHKHRYNN